MARCLQQVTIARTLNRTSTERRVTETRCRREAVRSGACLKVLSIADAIRLSAGPIWREAPHVQLIGTRNCGMRENPIAVPRCLRQAPQGILARPIQNQEGEDGGGVAKPDE
jgi:hypothetical protein